MSFWTSPRLNGLRRITRVVVHASAINPRYHTSKPSSFAAFHRPTVRDLHPQAFASKHLTCPLPVQENTMMSVNGIKKEKVVIVGSGNWYVSFQVAVLPEDLQQACTDASFFV